MGELVKANAVETATKMYVGKRTRPSYELSRERAKDASQSVKSWWNAPETKRKRRVAKYKLYNVEGKVKKSIKKGFRWIKKTCSRIVHGF